MSALSTAVQTFADHIIKKRISWLDTATPENPGNESRRQGMIHLASFLVGFALALSAGIMPLSYLGLPHGPTVNSLAAGLLVSFGGSFFNEVLGTVHEFKKAQKGLSMSQIPAAAQPQRTP